MIALVKPQLIDLPALEPQGKNNEWYTPARYIEAARRVMGGIDLDPASCEMANRTVKATRYYTQRENGLAQEWYGRVWLNPPFGRLNAAKNSVGGSTGGKSIMTMFINKLIWSYRLGEISQAVLLTMPKVDTVWFRYLWDYTICFTDHRVLFDRPGRIKDAQMFGTIFVYLGPSEQAFIDEFSQFGTIAKRVSTPRTKPAQLSLWEDIHDA